ncbi:DUF6328 family protein [Nonomuraea sp. N2-4H]|uniref:DUF6328 family protein n=1 Tax=Nonomuraea sp. N2-4H TaxID=3128898 RepID=UPI00324A3A8C
MLFRQGRKETLVRRSDLYGILGALALAVSMTTATMFVIDYLFDATVAWLTAGLLALLALWTWFGQPALDRSGALEHGGAGEERRRAARRTLSPPTAARCRRGRTDGRSPPAPPRTPRPTR